MTVGAPDPMLRIEPSEGRGASPALPWSLAVVVAAGLLLGACGDGSSSGAGEDVGAGGVAAPARTALTQPPSTDPDAVRPYLEELLVRYDEAVDQIVADPAVARDREDPLIREYLSLYEPGSEFAEQLIPSWVERADEGLSTRPIDDEHPASASRVDGEVTAVSPDEVSFTYCVERRYEIYDGETRLQQEQQEQPGRGVAVRVDGEWRLRELTVDMDATACGRE